MSPDSEPHPATPLFHQGEVIAGRYRLDGVLAEGGMGVVYRAWHLTLDQPIAIKIMRSELAIWPEAALRFLNEARSAAQLRGQHIARVLDSGTLGEEFKGALYIVMELLDGADLRAILQREGPLPRDRAVAYVRDACAALAEVHAAGIVHRDVKPENLFLARDRDGDGVEKIKLLDFGISKRVDGGGGFETREGLGSPHYMAPEQLTSACSVDARADVWSLGVVLYELLSGRLPFDGDNPAAIFREVLTCEPTPLDSVCPSLPPGLAEIVHRCLSKRAEDRWNNVQELSAALLGFASPGGRLDADPRFLRLPVGEVVGRGTHDGQTIPSLGPAPRAPVSLGIPLPPDNQDASPLRTPSGSLGALGAQHDGLTLRSIIAPPNRSAMRLLSPGASPVSEVPPLPQSRWGVRLAIGAAAVVIAAAIPVSTRVLGLALAQGDLEPPPVARPAAPVRSGMPLQAMRVLSPTAPPNPPRVDVCGGPQHHALGDSSCSPSSEGDSSAAARASPAPPRHGPWQGPEIPEGLEPESSLSRGSNDLGSGVRAPASPGRTASTVRTALELREALDRAARRQMEALGETSPAPTAARRLLPAYEPDGEARAGGDSESNREDAAARRVGRIKPADGLPSGLLPAYPDAHFSRRR